MTTRAAAVVHRVRAAGGVVRSRALVQAGISPHDIADAVCSGLLVRERRVWVAVPDADPQLRFAAREGVVLTCVTQAVRLKLWVLAAPEPHVACHPHAGGVAVAGAVVHRHQPLVPRDPAHLVDPIENVLQLVAVCQPFEAALAVWDSALNRGLADKPALHALPLRGAARRILESASPFRDSGLETFVPVRLRWLRVAVRSQTWLFGRPVDFLIGDRLVLQIDGGHHVGAQRASDIAHDAELMLRGYHVIRVTYAQVVDHWPEVQERILAAIARGLHRAA